MIAPGENAAIVRRFLDEVWNKKNEGKRSELSTFSPDPRGNPFRKAFPDAKLTIDYQVESGNDVITRYSVNGTHTGDYLGFSPTNKKVSYTAVFIHRVQNKKIVERWGAADGLGVLQQIGAVPGPSNLK